jgi:hypothetical protein
MLHRALNMVEEAMVAMTEAEGDYKDCFYSVFDLTMSTLWAVAVRRQGIRARLGPELGALGIVIQGIFKIN